MVIVMWWVVILQGVLFIIVVSWGEEEGWVGFGPHLTSMW